MCYIYSAMCLYFYLMVAASAKAKQGSDSLEEVWAEREGL